MTLWLRDEFSCEWQGRDPHEAVEKLQGTVFRELEARRTLLFHLHGKGYFVKIHRGIGWWEIIENLLRLRLPVLGAGNEWRALERLHQLGVETMTPVAYGVRGANPARQHSFIITEELNDTLSLEDLCADWPAHPPPLRLKRALLKRVAEMSRALHENGINHRDFYICHFLLKQPPRGEPIDPEHFSLSLIDLHRAQIRRKVPRRWIIKDMAGLWFSAMDIGLTQHDLFRFMRAYTGLPLRRALREKHWLWEQLQKKADKIYERMERKVRPREEARKREQHPPD
jgi:heptose I phosphotransferase